MPETHDQKETRIYKRLSSVSFHSEPSFMIKLKDFLSVWESFTRPFQRDAFSPSIRSVQEDPVSMVETQQFRQEGSSYFSEDTLHNAHGRVDPLVGRALRDSDSRRCLVNDLPEISHQHAKLMTNFCLPL